MLLDPPTKTVNSYDVSWRYVTGSTSTIATRCRHVTIMTQELQCHIEVGSMYEMCDMDTCHDLILDHYTLTMTDTPTLSRQLQYRIM